MISTFAWFAIAPFGADLTAIAAYTRRRFRWSHWIKIVLCLKFISFFARDRGIVIRTAIAIIA